MIAFYVNLDLFNFPLLGLASASQHHVMRDFQTELLCWVCSVSSVSINKRVLGCYWCWDCLKARARLPAVAEACCHFSARIWCRLRVAGSLLSAVSAPPPTIRLAPPSLTPIKLLALCCLQILHYSIQKLCSICSMWSTQASIHKIKIYNRKWYLTVIHELFIFGPKMTKWWPTCIL